MRTNIRRGDRYLAGCHTLSHDRREGRQNSERKRRFDSEGYLNPSLYETKFSLSAGNTSEEIAGGSTPSSTPDSRVITPCKGLLVRPNNPRGWCVHLVRDGAQLESVKGETVKETAEKVIERNLFQYAEKAPAPPPPEPPRTQQAPSYRRRPGSI
jgi:hypothetical protein